MNNQTPPFQDHCATVRGLQVAEQKAPLFAQHVKETREKMERAAQELEDLGCTNSAKAIWRLARDL